MVIHGAATMTRSLSARLPHRDVGLFLHGTFNVGGAGIAVAIALGSYLSVASRNDAIKPSVSTHLQGVETSPGLSHPEC